MCGPGTWAEIIVIAEPRSWLTARSVASFFPDFLKIQKKRRPSLLVRDFSKAHAQGCFEPSSVVGKQQNLGHAAEPHWHGQIQWWLYLMMLFFHIVPQVTGNQIWGMTHTFCCTTLNHSSPTLEIKHQPSKSGTLQYKLSRVKSCIMDW